MPADDPPDGRRPILEIADLGVQFASGGRTFRAVDHVSLSIAPGERFGMVGETGAGKSLIAWAAVGLLPRAARMTSGHVWYEGNDLTTASPEKLSSLRGREIAFIVQNPAAALSPITRIGDQLVNAYRAHRKTDRATATARAIEGLRQVGIPDPARRARSYPHELSIGMAQRVLIAMALLHEPKLLIADEPTSGLDVTIQAEILDLVMELVRERNTALWLITHDLGVVAHYCERAAVIFAGSIVETGPVATLFNNPAHPYTRGLVDSRLTDDRGRERFNIAGAPPDLSRKAVGCRFAYRCPWVEERCRQEEPALSPLEAGHEVRCWVAQERSRRPDDTDQGAKRRRLCPARAGNKNRGAARRDSGPRQAFPRRRPVGAPRRGRRRPRHRPRRSGRAGRRKRQRQIDSGPLPAPDHRRLGGGNPLRRAGHRPAAECRGTRTAPAHADGVPGPARLPRSTPDPRVRSSRSRCGCSPA